MALPQLTAADVEAIVPNCKVVAPPLGGGQKIVYPCCIDGHQWAVKFILLGELKDDLDGDVQSKIDTILNDDTLSQEIDILNMLIKYY